MIFLGSVEKEVGLEFGFLENVESPNHSNAHTVIIIATICGSGMEEEEVHLRVFGSLIYVLSIPKIAPS